MRVVTAPEKYEKGPQDVFVFLAGGISNCPEWQNEIISRLSEIEGLDHLVLFNPRRENFPIQDPNAAQEQITWEFNYLEQMDIFSMFFCGGESDQPICMYELGRNLTRHFVRKHPLTYKDSVIISCHSGYRRASDVKFQVFLATHEPEQVYFSDDYCDLYDHHAKEILLAYRKFIANIQPVDAFTEKLFKGID